MKLKNSIFNVDKSDFFNKKISLQGSKSQANRYLILASVLKKKITVRNLPDASDVVSMIRCLKAIGLDIVQSSERDIIVNNTFPECEIKTDDTIEIKAGDGGTTNRFLTALVARGSNKYRFIPEEKMASRPMKELFDFLKKLGATVNFVEGEYWEIQGPIFFKEPIEIDCSETTQFLSALMLANPNNLDSIVPINLNSSSQYVHMTKKAILDNLDEYIIPIDFSSLGYPLALGAVAGRVEIDPFYGIDELQPDSQFLEILKKMGVSVVENNKKLIVERNGNLKSINLDCSAFPDLVPTLAFVCSKANGKSVLSNIEVLKHKESDRIEETLKILESFNVKASYDDVNDEMTIFGSDDVVDVKDIVTARDHRLIMVSYLFLRTHNGGTIANSDCVEKSFADFFEVME